MTTIVDEATTGEGEEAMMDVSKEFIPKGRSKSPIDEGITTGGREDGTSGELIEEDILMIQIPSIDSLLGDIYDL